MKGPACISYMQQYFYKAKAICKFCYEFKGDLDFEILEQAVDTVYAHNQVLQYNVHECEDKQNLQFVKNSEGFQKELNKQKKVVKLNISDLESELKYLHNEAPQALEYGNGYYLPLKIYVLTGYKEKEFGLYFLWDHIYFDGTNINFQVNEIFQIYSKLLKKQSLESHIKSLEARYFVDDEEFLEKYFKPQVGFWQHFINTIRMVKLPSGDPAKLRWDYENDHRELNSDSYQQSFERNSKQLFQFSQNYDFSQIVQEVRKSYPQVSKNSIVQAYIQRFFDYYAVNVRAKELNVEPESIRGLMSYGFASKNVPYEEYAKIAGNYVGQLMQAFDVRNYKTFEDLALANHNETQKLKKQKQSISAQASFNPVFSNKEQMNFLLSLNVKHTYASTSWTNVILNNNVHMLEGAEFFRVTQAVVYKIADEPDLPNFFAAANMFITNIAPKDDVSFTFTSMNTELNEKIQKEFGNYYQHFCQEYFKSDNIQLKPNQAQN